MKDSMVFIKLLYMQKRDDETLAFQLSKFYKIKIILKIKEAHLFWIIVKRREFGFCPRQAQLCQIFQFSHFYFSIAK